MYERSPPLQSDEEGLSSPFGGFKEEFSNPPATKQLDLRRRRSEAGEVLSKPKLWRLGFLKDKVEKDGDTEVTDSKPERSRHSVTEGAPPKATKMKSGGLWGRLQPKNNQGTESGTASGVFSKQDEPVKSDKSEHGKSNGVFGFFTGNKTQNGKTAPAVKSRTNSFDDTDAVNFSSGSTTGVPGPAVIPSSRASGLESAKSLPLADEKGATVSKPHRRSGSMSAMKLLSFTKRGIDEPVEVRQPELGIDMNAGLYNLGNQCFFNAFLQVLYHAKAVQPLIWETYPNLPPLPEYIAEDPLMRYSGRMAGPRTPERQPSTLPSPSPSSAQSTDRLNELGSTQPVSREPSVAELSNGPGKALNPSPSEPLRQDGLGVESLPPHGLPHLHIETSQPSDNAPSIGQQLSCSPSSRRSADGQSPVLQPIPETKELDSSVPPYRNGTTWPENLLDRSSPGTPRSGQSSPTHDSANVPRLQNGTLDHQPQEVKISIPAEADALTNEPGSRGSNEVVATETSTGDGAPLCHSNPATPARAAAQLEQSPGGRQQLNQIAEMSKRVNELTKKQGINKTDLSLAFAYVFREMELSTTPVNPLPVFWMISQLSANDDLINGEQQDIHEASMLVRQMLDEHKCAQMGGAFSSLFQGKKKIKRTCKPCGGKGSTVEEEFGDLSVNPVPEAIGGAGNTEDVLKHFCKPKVPTAECSRCAERRKNPDKPWLQSMREALTTPSNKDHEDCMKELTTFVEVPDCLVIHISRTHYTGKGDKLGFLAKDERPIAPSLMISLWDHMTEEVKSAPENTKEDFDYRLFGVVLHQGGRAEQGHYLALCRTTQETDSWMRFDDEKEPTPVKVKNLKKDASKHALDVNELEMREVSMMFYEKVKSPVTVRSERIQQQIQALRSERTKQLGALESR